MIESHVPSLDLKAHHESIKEEILTAIHRVVDSNQFIMGPEVVALEQKVAEYCRTKYCIGVSSGSDALIIALMALGVQPGDEIITTPFTFFATVGAISRLGAKAVFVDIDPLTYNLKPEQIAGKVTSKTKGIIPVHLYGQCAEMDPILELAHERNLFVIEDAAQSIGAEYKGRRAGSMGTAGCFSFFPSKNLGAFGDGGAVVTNDDDLAEKLRVLRVHGSKPKYYHHLVGGNFRLDALQAAVVRVKLNYLDGWTEGRQRAAQRYDDLFQEKSLQNTHVQLPAVVQDRHIYNQYVVRTQQRDALRDHLTKNGVGNAIYYPVSLHLQKCFSYLSYKKGDFPESERASRETLALPMFPELTEAQQRSVVDCVERFFVEPGRKNAA